MVRQRFGVLLMAVAAAFGLVACGSGKAQPSASDGANDYPQSAISSACLPTIFNVGTRPRAELLGERADAVSRLDPPADIASAQTRFEDALRGLSLIPAVPSAANTAKIDDLAAASQSGTEALTATTKAGSSRMTARAWNPQLGMTIWSLLPHRRRVLNAGT